MGDVTVVAVAVVVMHDRIMTTFTGAMCVCGFVYIPDVEHECERVCASICFDGSENVKIPWPETLARSLSKYMNQYMAINY